MKKILLLCLITMLSLCAFSQVTIMVSVCIENEYSRALESPLKYGLTPEDFTFELIHKNSGGDYWPNSHPQWKADDKVCLVTLYSYVPLIEECEFIATINKPGHKLHGLSASFTTTLKPGPNNFVLNNGWVLRIPE